MVTVYAPALSPLNTYAPLSSVEVSRFSPVALVNTTFAPVTTA